jgi:cytoskeletal protein CcmA (bactofilin family)
MSDSQAGNTSLLNSIIGEGTRFKGEFDLSGLLRIDGDFNGTIRTKGKILIGLNGRAECNIYAETIVVGGIVKGNLFSTEKVVILSTGMMIGNINAPRLIIEEGVVLNGSFKITGRKIQADRQASKMKKNDDGIRRNHEYDDSRETVFARN